MHVQKKLPETCPECSTTFTFPAAMSEDSICSISSSTFGAEIILILALCLV